MATEDYTDWLAELDAYGDGGGGGGGGGRGLHSGGLESGRGGPRSTRSAATSRTGGGGGMSTIEELEQEMKLLHWHKLANEAALKAAIIRTKRLRDSDKSIMRSVRHAEKAEWMRRVVEEEKARPLEVTDDYVADFQQKEMVDEERLETQVEHHIHNLKKLRSGLEKRAVEKERYARYREMKEALGPAPTSIEEFNAMPTTPASRASAGTPNTDRSSASGRGGKPKSLQNVLESLDKLVALEKRITNLESGAEAAEASGSAPSAAPGATTLSFTKKRTGATLTQPSKTVFAIKVVDKSKVPAKRFARGKAGLSVQSRTMRNTRKAPKSVVRIERMREKQDKRARDRKRAQRQDAVIGDWLKNKRQKETERRRRIQARTQARAKATRRGPPTAHGGYVRPGVKAPARSGMSHTTGGVGARGARGARGRQTTGLAAARTRGRAPPRSQGGVHMQQFHQMRADFDKRKTAMRYANKGRDAPRGQRSTSKPRPPGRTITRSRAPLHSTHAGGRGGANVRPAAKNRVVPGRVRGRPAWGSSAAKSKGVGGTWSRTNKRGVVAPGAKPRPAGAFGGPTKRVVPKSHGATRGYPTRTAAPARGSTRKPGYGGYNQQYRSQGARSTVRAGGGSTGGGRTGGGRTGGGVGGGGALW